MRRLLQMSLLLGVISCSWHTNTMSESAKESLAKLKEGNARFSQKKLKAQEVSTSKTPLAVVVSCSDCLLTPETIFDQQLGDIYAVRVAANVVGPIELDSIEFAVDKLHTPLIIVLGHKNCDALAAIQAGKAVEANLENIKPLVDGALLASKKKPGDPLYTFTVANTQAVAACVLKSPLIQELYNEGKVTILCAYYDEGTNSVHFLN